MSFLSIFDAVTPIINKVLDFIPDPQQKLQAQQAIMQELSQLDSQQAAINQQEASSNSLFVAGWRPFIGWACGIAFAYHYVVEPLLMLGITCYRSVCTQPSFDMSTLSTVLMGMLGLGGLRTIEKLQGVK